MPETKKETSVKRNVRFWTIQEDKLLEKYFY